jgi:hypothetical protein
MFVSEGFRDMAIPANRLLRSEDFRQLRRLELPPFGGFAIGPQKRWSMVKTL